MKYLMIIGLVLLGFNNQAQSLYSQLEKASSFDQIEYPYEVHKQMLSNNIEVAYMDEGKANQTILFIHGLGSYASAWKKTIEGLKSNYRCIAIDLPGYGRSSKGNYPCSMSFYATIVHELLDSLSLDQVILAGHSMGGQISIVASLKKPERVQKLMLVSPAGIETFTEGEKDWFRTAISAKGVMLTPLNSIEENLGHNFYKFPKDAEYMIKDRYAMTGCGDDFLWYCKAIERSIQGMVNEPVIRDLSKLNVPTLLVFGESDKLIPNRYLHGGSTRNIGEKAERNIQHSQLVMVKKAGHFVMFEKAELVNGRMLEFLGSNTL